MNLLLLLSALLSALSGAVSGVRAQPVAQAVCLAGTTARVAGAVRAVASTRPMQALPVLAAVLSPPRVLREPAFVRIAIFASRRRE